MSDNSNTLLGIIAGSAIGAALGILYAPDRGTNTRRRLIDEAQATKNNLEKSAYDIKNQVLHSLSDKKESMDTRIDSIVSDVSYKTEDVITTLEGKLSELKARNKKLQKS